MPYGAGNSQQPVAELVEIANQYPRSLQGVYSFIKYLPGHADKSITGGLPDRVGPKFGVQMAGNSAAALYW